jgi:NAD(P)H-dependent FMN reductase
MKDPIRIAGTPLYHGSYSGVLKNAIDPMGFHEFEDKMVGLVGVSGGRMGAGNALTVSAFSPRTHRR